MKTGEILHSLMLSHRRTEGQDFHIRSFLLLFFFTFIRRPKMSNKPELNLLVIYLLNNFRTTRGGQNYQKDQN